MNKSLIRVFQIYVFAFAFLFASRPMGVARSIASGTSDASSRGEPPALSRADFEHRADVWSREEHTVGREANDADDAIIAVQEHRVDGEPHPERVNRTSVFQEESLARFES